MNGQFDVLYNNVASTISAIDRGFDLRVVMGGSPNGSKPPGQSALMKRRGDAIRSARISKAKPSASTAFAASIGCSRARGFKLTGGDPEKSAFSNSLTPC